MTRFLSMFPQRHRTLAFASINHVWSDLFYAMLIPLLPLMKGDPDLNLSFTQAGLIRTVHSGASAALQIPFGFLSEFTGEFWLIIGGNIWVALGMIGIALASNFPFLLGVTLIGGLGGGTQHPLASGMVSRAYETGSRSTAVGAVNFAGDLGKMAAPVMAWLIASPFGWRATFKFVGIAAIAVIPLSALVRKSIVENRSSSETKVTEFEESGSVRMAGFINLSVLGFLDSAVRGAALTFLPFLMIEKGMSVSQIFAMLFLLLAGGAIGKLALGWLDERYGPVTLIWATKGLTALLLLASIPAPNFAMVPLLVVLGIGLNGTSSVLYANVPVFVPPKLRGRSYGFFYTTNEAGAAIAPALYGILADIVSIRTTIFAMSLITSLILPTSFLVRRHLVSTGRKDLNELMSNGDSA